MRARVILAALLAAGGALAPAAARAVAPALFLRAAVATHFASRTGAQLFLVTTLAGAGTNTYSNGVGTNAGISSPIGVAVDADGMVLVGDSSNRIRMITPAGSVTTIAGSGAGAFADGVGTNAKFNIPQGVAILNKTVYVADSYNHRVRMISSAGYVSTLAGSGALAFADGEGIFAQFNYPKRIAVDKNGIVYVADTSNHRIRTFTPAGDVSTLAGSGLAAFADGMGESAAFYNPTGIALDVNGNVFVADTYNYRVRVIAPDGNVSTLAGLPGYGFVDGSRTRACFDPMKVLPSISVEMFTFPIQTTNVSARSRLPAA